MTLSTVAVNDPVLASTHQQLIAKINASPGRQIFTANGTFTVPNGIHKFRVFMCPGGQSGFLSTIGGLGEDSFEIPGIRGANGRVVSVDYAGVDLGTSFNVIIGAGGVGGLAADGVQGGTSSFGATFSITGPGPGTGTPGVVTAPGGSTPMYHYGGFYGDANGPYGEGGAGASASGIATGSGRQGVVVVEW